MKIGIYDPYLDTLSGGEKYMLTLGSCLAKDNEVSIFWDQSTEEIKREAKRKLDIDLANIKFAQNIFSASYPKTQRLLQSKKYDLIVFLSDGSIPIVLTRLIVHFQFPVEWVKNSFKNRFKIKRTEKIICNSKFTKSFIDKKFKVESAILYPPCEIKPQNIKKENIILHVGRFGKDLEGKNFKKQDVMIDAFKKLNPKSWKFILVIGRVESQLKDVQKLKVRAKGYNIEIVENPNNDRLWKLYSKSKIYWHASGFGENLSLHPEKSEHFGISTVEAMGAGVVPVVIDAGGQPEIVKEGTNGYLWNSIDELLQKTQSLIDNEDLLNKISRKAILRSKDFSENIFCKQVYEIIK